MRIVTASGLEMTAAELAAEWVGQMSEQDRADIRAHGAAGWREGVSCAKGLDRPAPDEVIAEIERLCGAQVAQ